MGALKKGDHSTQFRSATEREIVRAYLSSRIESASMAALALGIPRPNMTRHKAKLQQMKILRVVGRGICKVTGRKVDFITCINNLLATRKDEIKEA